MQVQDDGGRGAQLTRWMARVLEDPGLVLEGIELPAGVGHSSETMAFDAVLGTGRRVGLVLRTSPSGDAVFPTYDLAVQVGALRAVRAGSHAPVPEVLAVDLAGSELGVPAYVMARIDGEVPADRIPYTLTGWLFDAAPEHQAQVWDSTLRAMAQVHTGDYADADLSPLDRTSHGPTGLRQLLAWWDGYARWVCRDQPHDLLEAAGRWLDEQVPTSVPPTTLLWGDARLSNALYSNGEVTALLDWEMAGLGPAEVDVAWFHFFDDFFSDGLGVPRLAGIPSRGRSLARYEELLGRPLHDLRWYEVFAAWRHTAIMARLADLWVADGTIPGEGQARVNNPASRLLAALLDLPAPGPPGGPMG